MSLEPYICQSLIAFPKMGTIPVGVDPAMVEPNILLVMEDITNDNNLKCSNFVDANQHEVEPNLQDYMIHKENPSMNVQYFFERLLDQHSKY